MRKTLALVATLTAAGCAAETGKGPVPDVVAGKADGDLDITEHDPLVWGEAHGAELGANVAHAWPFELDAGAEVAFETGGDVDTVLYVHDGAGTELAVDDDGGRGRLSALRLSLEAGSYRVLVAGYADDEEGPFELAAGCTGDGCGEGGGADPDDGEQDPWALAKDVHHMRVALTDATPIPERGDIVRAPTPLRLSGPEWWQRWPGGVTQGFGWEDGTDYGKRCGVAASVRLRAIWDYETTGEDGEARWPGREAFEALIDESGWGGSMFNWIEDISEGGSPIFTPATLWAWRTGTVKWISVVHPDGSCDLPTLELVQVFSEQCRAQASHEDGAIEGCRASGH